MLITNINIKEESTMGQENFNIKNRKGKHLTYEERIKIEALNKIGQNSRELPRKLKILMNTRFLKHFDKTYLREYYGFYSEV